MRGPSLLGASRDLVEHGDRGPRCGSVAAQTPSSRRVSQAGFVVGAGVVGGGVGAEKRRSVRGFPRVVRTGQVGT